MYQWISGTGASSVSVRQAPTTLPSLDLKKLVAKTFDLPPNQYDWTDWHWGVYCQLIRLAGDNLYPPNLLVSIRVDGENVFDYPIRFNPKSFDVEVERLLGVAIKLKIEDDSQREQRDWLVLILGLVEASSLGGFCHAV